MQQKHIRIPDELLAEIDRERRKEADFPGFSEMVRRLLNEAITYRETIAIASRPR